MCLTSVYVKIIVIELTEGTNHYSTELSVVMLTITTLSNRYISSALKKLRFVVLRSLEIFLTIQDGMQQFRIKRRLSDRPCFTLNSHEDVRKDNNGYVVTKNVLP